jgi:hypothetical protein
MSISSIAPSAPLKPPEASEPKPPEVKPPEVKVEAGVSRTAQPTVLAALPPGQGTRVNQLA